MAGVITDISGASYTNGALQATIPQLQQNVPQVTQGYADFIWAAPTADTVLVIPSGITALGVAWFWNLDPSNYCDIGPTVAGAIAPFMRLQGGAAGAAASRSGMVPLSPGIVIRTLAHTAVVNLQVWIFNA